MYEKSDAEVYANEAASAPAFVKVRGHCFLFFGGLIGLFHISLRVLLSALF